jgi:hypothetical protein
MEGGRIARRNFPFNQWINGYFSDLTTLPSVGDGKGLHVGVPVL